MSDTDNRIKIVRGSDREFNVRIIDQDTKEPFDLTTVTDTDIKAEFVKSDLSCLSLTGSASITIVSALGGKIKITMTPADTLALKVGLGQSFELEITKTAKLSIVQFEGCLDVLKQVC